MTALKLISEHTEADDQINVNVFAGKDTDHYQHAGTLTLGIGGWQVLGAMLLIGNEKVNEEHHFYVTLEFDDVLAREVAGGLLDAER